MPSAKKVLGSLCLVNDTKTKSVAPKSLVICFLGVMHPYFTEVETRPLLGNIFFLFHLFLLNSQDSHFFPLIFFR